MVNNDAKAVAARAGLKISSNLLAVAVRVRTFP